MIEDAYLMYKIGVAIAFISISAGGCAVKHEDVLHGSLSIASVDHAKVLSYLRKFGYESTSIYSSWQSLDGSKAFFQEPATKSDDRSVWLLDPRGPTPLHVTFNSSDGWIDPSGKVIKYPPYLSPEKIARAVVDRESGYFFVRADGTEPIRVGHILNRARWLFEVSADKGNFLPNQIASIGGRVILLQASDGLTPQAQDNCLIARQDSKMDGGWTFARKTLKGSIIATFESDSRILIGYRHLMFWPLSIALHDIDSNKYDNVGDLMTDKSYFLMKHDWISSKIGETH